MTNLDQQPLYIDFKDLIELSVNHDEESIEVDCSINLEVDGIEYKAYGVSLAYRDLLFYTDKGTIQYLIDSYSDNHTAVLYDYDLD